jgi:hypothetical protein
MICRFRTWSLDGLAEFLDANGVVNGHRHDGPAVLPSEDGVTFQRL